MKSPVLILWPSGAQTMSTERRRRRFTSRKNDSAHASTCSSLPEVIDVNHLQQQQQQQQQQNQIQQSQQFQPAQPQQPEVKSGIHHVTVVVMGASGVGKTAMLRQFVYNEFSEAYRGTCLKDYHYVTLVVNERIYEVKLVDCSQVTTFPSSSLQEWTDYRGFCLRNASAYLLVYDVTDDDSFRYVRTIFEQMQKSRNLHDVPVLVVANKLDLLTTLSQASSSTSVGCNSSDNHHHHHHHHHHHLHHFNHRRRHQSGKSSSQSYPSVASVQNGLTSCCHGSSSHGNADGVGSTLISDKHHLRLNRQEQANLVKKQMKCSFMECSAMLNWRVTSVFRELMRALDQARFGHSSRVQDAFRNQRCLVS